MEFEIAQITMKPISPYTLMGVGLILIFLEMVFSSFFVIFFGISALIIGFATFIYPFENGYTQLLIFALLTIVNFITLRNILKDKFLQPAEEFQENILNESGTGVIKDGRVLYKGTHWNFTANNSKLKSSDFSEGEEIKVIKIEHNKAIISKI
jgi:membrane protein implicated in regulation of membrane protease activity